MRMGESKEVPGNIWNSGGETTDTQLLSHVFAFVVTMEVQSR